MTSINKIGIKFANSFSKLSFLVCYIEKLALFEFLCKFRKMGKFKQKKFLGKIGFKKGYKPHNVGITYEKEFTLSTSEPKYVRLEENGQNIVSNKLLPDSGDVKSVPVQTEFRLLRPKRSPGTLVDCLAETETDTWYL